MVETSEESYLYTLTIVFIVISIFNLFFTLIILALLLKYISKKAHNDIILTTIAVIIDLLASLGLLFRGIFFNYRDNILKIYYNWCAFDVCVNSIFLLYSGYALSMLSLERMLLIAFNISFSLYFWLFWLFLLYSLLFTQAIYQSIIGNATVSPIQVFCIFKLNSASKPFYYSLTACSILTYSLTVSSYIILIVFCSRHCLRQIECNVPKATVYKECRVIIAKSLLFLIPYMIMYSGKIYVWIYEWSTGIRRTWIMEYTATILSAMTVIVNCLTVLYMNEKVKSEFVGLIVKCKNRLFNRNPTNR